MRPSMEWVRRSLHKRRSEEETSIPLSQGQQEQNRGIHPHYPCLMEICHRLLQCRQSLSRKIIFLMSIKLQGINNRRRDRERRLAQPKIVYLFAFSLEMFTSIINSKSCRLAIATDIYIKADMFTKTHFLVPLQEINEQYA